MRKAKYKAGQHFLVGYRLFTTCSIYRDDKGDYYYHDDVRDRIVPEKTLDLSERLLEVRSDTE